MNPQKKMVYVQRIFNPNQSRSTGLGTFNQDNFLRVMAESIDKALSTTESPVKEKHVRRILIGTHQAESALFFWNNLHVTRLKENQIVCWKFCHLLHKMLKDGHRQVLNNSYDRRQILLDCGNMWRHIEDGYGKLIYKYCTLLYNRINFLARNTGFPNDLKLSDQQLDEIGSRDLGIFFQLSCEMFDALDDILALQEVVLTSLETKKLNSMTNAGRCLLSPLVACIQDSTLLYDYTVKVLFKLHNGLPSSTLEGHRERFTLLHKSLKNFYINASNLQFFKTLIQIPHLNERPPNFLIASDLNQHVTPKVIMIAEPERDSPDHFNSQSDSSAQQLVNLTEENVQFDNSDYIPSNSSICTSTNRSLSSMLDQFDSVPIETLQRPNEDESILKQKLEELEECINSLKSELEIERANHQMTKQTLEAKISSLDISWASKVSEEEMKVKKLKEELAKLNHQFKMSQNCLKEIQDERDRAKHDSEINKEAMKKLVKDLSDLKNHNARSSVAAPAPLENGINERLIDELRSKINNLTFQLQEQQLRKQEWERERELLTGTKLKLEKQLEDQQKDLLTAEMDETDKILREASKKIEELSEKSRRLETGVKLQVNEKIAEVCSNLMKTVRNLIIQSRLLQREIVADGKHASNIDFYMRNSSWTEGLISAANVVAMAARSLVDSADMAMSGRAKFSELAAAAHEVASATTQLVVASRVKADKDSEKLKILTGVAKQVNQCTNNVVDTAHVCAELIEQEIDKVDISSLSLHQTKKLEMETQVKLLELEDQLSKERVKLGVLRRQHYEQEDAQANKVID